MYNLNRDFHSSIRYIKTTLEVPLTDIDREALLLIFREYAVCNQPRTKFISNIYTLVDFINFTGSTDL